MMSYSITQTSKIPINESQADARQQIDLGKLKKYQPRSKP